MSEQELIEQLAEKWHASRAHWMNALFSACDVVGDRDGHEYYVIPRELMARWKQQAGMSYHHLSDREKQADRDEVAPILPVIDDYLQQAIVAISNAQIQQGVRLSPTAMRRAVKERDGKVS